MTTAAACFDVHTDASPQTGANDAVHPGLIGGGSRGRELSIVRDAGAVTVHQGNERLLCYRFQGGGQKPYVLALPAPNGVNVLRDAPADHLHHHGMMFACRANGVNFWEERANSGRQVHTDWKALRLVPSGDRKQDRAVLNERLQWQRPDGRAVLYEERTLSIAAARPGEPRVLTWQTTLLAPAQGEPVTLTGTAYNGLGARFLAAMDTGDRFLNAGGGRGVTRTNGQPAAWCSYAAEPSPGQPVTIAMFDDPANPRHPNRWYTMNKPFAYLSASLGVDTAPVKLSAGERLSLRWGVALFNGAVDGKAIEAAYQRWQKDLVN